LVLEEHFGAVERYNFTEFPSMFILKDATMLSRYYG
jgi:hypothetical protein